MKSSKPSACVCPQASVFGVRAGKELLLELRLLDALVTLPRDAYAMQARGWGERRRWLRQTRRTRQGRGSRVSQCGGAPPALAPCAQAAGGTTHGNTGMSRPPVECTLMVLVSRAENLPTVRCGAQAGGKGSAR